MSPYVRLLRKVICEMLANLGATETYKLLQIKYFKT